MDEELRAELLAAVHGIPSVLDGKATRDTDLVRAMRLGDKATAVLRGFLGAKAFERQTVDLPAVDYLATLDKLSRPPGMDDLEAAMAGIPDHRLAQAYAAVLSRGLSYLAATIPRRNQRTVTGDTPVEPSQMDMSRFRRTWQIAVNPLQVLDDLGEGILVRDQVAALGALYPRILAAIREELFRLLTERKPDDTLPLRKQRQLEVLLDISILDPRFAAELQERAAEARAPRTVPVPERFGEREGLPTLRVQSR